MKMIKLPRLQWNGTTIIGCVILLAIAANYVGSVSIGNRSPLSRSNKEASLNDSLSYPALTCPLIPGSTTTNLYLPSIKVGYHPLQGAASATKGFSFSQKRGFTLKDPVLLAGSSSIATTEINGNGWSAITPCAVGNGNSWFVGGTGDITSNDQLVIDNSGSSVATIAINIFTEHGPITAVNRSIKPNTQVTFSMSSIAPGEKSPVINVVTVSGRVTAFLVDKRSKGLTTLGGSMIPTSQAPALNVTIMGLSGKSMNDGFVRIYNSSVATAHVTGSLFSSSGNFTPVGFDSIDVPAQKVIEVAIPNIATNGLFALQLSSDQPIAAGGFIGVQSAFTWFSSEGLITPTSITLPAIKPVINLLGSKIHVLVSWVSTPEGGTTSRGSHILSGSDFISWSLPESVNRVSLTPLPGDAQTIGTILALNGEGVLAPISMPSGLSPIDRSTPIPDARIISRG
jgi:hypothetical protein